MATTIRREPTAVAPASTPWAWQRWFLAGAGISFLISVGAWFLVDREVGLFVGVWVPSILSLGAFLAAARQTRS